jgi:hypothetical protein
MNNEPDALLPTTGCPQHGLNISSHQAAAGQADQIT